MGNDSRTVERHLRAASDAILLLIDEVAQLERHKRAVPPDDPRFRELAASVRQGANALAEFALQEESWAAGASSAGPGVRPIDRSATSRDLNAILEQWRAVERALDGAEPGSSESVRLFEEFRRLRDEYLSAFRAREQA